MTTGFIFNGQDIDQQLYMRTDIDIKAHYGASAVGDFGSQQQGYLLYQIADKALAANILIQSYTNAPLTGFRYLLNGQIRDFGEDAMLASSIVFLPAPVGSGAIYPKTVNMGTVFTNTSKSVGFALQDVSGGFTNIPDGFRIIANTLTGDTRFSVDSFSVDTLGVVKASFSFSGSTATGVHNASFSVGVVASNDAGESVTYVTVTYSISINVEAAPTPPTAGTDQLNSLTTSYDISGSTVSVGSSWNVSNYFNQGTGTFISYDVTTLAYEGQNSGQIATSSNLSGNTLTISHSLTRTSSGNFVEYAIVQVRMNTTAGTSAYVSFRSRRNLTVNAAPTPPVGNGGTYTASGGNMGTLDPNESGSANGMSKNVSGYFTNIPTSYSWASLGWSGSSSGFNSSGVSVSNSGVVSANISFSGTSTLGSRSATLTLRIAASNGDGTSTTYVYVRFNVTLNVVQPIVPPTALGGSTLSPSKVYVKNSSNITVLSAWTLQNYFNQGTGSFVNWSVTAVGYDGQNSGTITTNYGTTGAALTISHNIKRHTVVSNQKDWYTVSIAMITSHGTSGYVTFKSRITVNIVN